MPKIELAENDGYLYDDGQPKTFIFRVDGHPFPVDHSVSIGEFFRRVGAVKLPLGNGVREDRHSTAGIADPPLSQAVPQARSTSPGITVGDIIRCRALPDNLGDPTGKGMDNEKPVVGKEYLVQKVVMKNSVLLGFEATPIHSDWPQRVFLRFQDVELVRKADPKEELAPARPQTILACLTCSKDMVFEMNTQETSYGGKCEGCGSVEILKIGECECACGEVNRLILYKNTFIGRCKKCNKEQKVIFGAVAGAAVL